MNKCKGPLHNVRVLDLSLVFPGPLCAMYLGDMGAEVIKIEPIRYGDPGRRMGEKMNAKDVSGVYLMANRNKKSLTLNLKKAKGQEILKLLLKETDVLIEGFKPGLMASLKLGYNDIREAFPRLIYCHISSFGHHGPYSQKMGHDGNFIALSGVLDSIGSADGPPVLPGVQIGDIGGAYVALSSILASLYVREKSKQGQFIDVSLHDAAFSFMSIPAGEFFASNREPERGKTTLSGILPNYSPYECADGKYIILSALEYPFFESFLRTLNHEHLMTLFQKDQWSADLKQELEKTFKSRKRDEWITIFKGLENACLSSIHSLKEAFMDPHLKAREMIIEMTHPRLGSIVMIGAPFKFSESLCTYREVPPDLGEHTELILGELGFTKTDTQNLKKEGII